MKRWAIFCAAAWSGLCFAACTGAASAAEITVLSTTAMDGILKQLIPEFERSTGNKIALTLQTSGAAAKRIAAGEASPDIAILTGPLVEDLIKQGKITAESREDIARLNMGVGVRAGAAKPDISSTAAFKQALLAAKSIAYPDPAGGGATGIYFVKVLAQLGIADAVKAKTKLASGPVGALLADGSAELGIQQIPELKAVPGVDIVGPLPPEFQITTVLTMGIVAASKQPDAAKAFVKFLVTPAAVSVIRATGMDPG
jgi:molybdate transport system substrate-binding protein